MSSIKNPQEKKRLNYDKDRRNCYGENDKGSRKSIRRNKKINSRSFRTPSHQLSRLANQSFVEDFSLEVEADVVSSEKLIRRKGFKKVPDCSLRSHVGNKQELRKKRSGRRAANKGNSPK